ncbi:LacI family DNA-binding transcriptional regulator [Conyzicola sp.]|uniref:LacI family DNA-binding transcriptional regulator n=1 Tax=Conyzicola sp. TaxID=1969404 RepID=UPI003988BBEB
MARVTSTDVAREAGLSRATVSYVLNADPRQRIPEPTRQRVLEAAARLEYVPYGPARLLRGAPGTTVVLVTPSLATAAEPVGARIVADLAETLTSRGLQLLWQLGSAVAGMSSDLAPVLVLTSLGEDEVGFSDLVRNSRVPVRSIFPGLDAFQAAPGRAQVDHLFSRGHRVLGFAAPYGPLLHRPSALRRDAVLARAHELGLPEPRIFAMPSDRAEARVKLEALFALDQPPRAICAYNDRVALVILAAAADLGISVPGDLAVIGVDDDPVSQLSIPALSSVGADLGSFVADLAAEVAALVAGEDPVGVRLPVRPMVVARDSS